MKKIIAILMVVIMLATLCSCGHSRRTPHTDYIFLSFEKVSVDERGSTNNYTHRVVYYIYTSGHVAKNEHTREENGPIIPTELRGEMSEAELEEVLQIVERQRNLSSNNEIDNGYLWTIEEYGHGDATLSKYVGSISQNEDYMRLLEIVESIAYSEWDF